MNETFRDPVSGRRMKLGEVGCALSHIEAWKKVSELPAGQYGLVFEDDAKFTGLVQYIDQVLEEASEFGSEFVYLAYREHGGRKRNELSKSLLSCVYNYWALAYALSSEGAKKLVSASEQYKHNLIPSDEYLPIVLGTLDSSVREQRVERLSCEPDLGCTGTKGEDPRYPELRLSCSTVKHQLAQPYFDKETISDTESTDPVSSGQSVDREVVVFTVATDEAHFGFETLRRSANYYGYDLRVLGLGEDWKGGDMARTTGGGVKLIYMQTAIREIPDSQLVLFVDGYDTVFQYPASVLLARFREIGADVLFGAEKDCWPSEEVCEQYALRTDGVFRYLNSGTYMGNAGFLKDILAEFEDNPEADDQLFFSRYLRDYRHGKRKTRVLLDTECSLFQTLSSFSRPDWDCYGPTYRLSNTITSTKPVVIHGNGASKRTLIGLTNYLAGAYTDFYETLRHQPLPVSDEELYPLVIGLFVKEGPFVQEFIESVMELDIDRERTQLVIFAKTKNHVVDPEKRNTFASFAVLSSKTESGARSTFLRQSTTAKYAVMIDSDYLILRPDAIRRLAGWRKPVVTGHARRHEKLWANYWSDMRPDGWYQRGFDTLALYERKSIGLFQVPYAASFLVIRGDYANLTASFFESHEDAGDDCVRRVCVDWINGGVGVYADNRVVYGELLASEEYAQPDSLYPSLFEASENPQWWRKRYMVKKHHEVPLDEKCPDAYAARVFNDRFCKELREVVIAEDNWSSGKNDDERIQGGYENVPTQDIHMNQFGWHESWETVLRLFLRPLVYRAYEGFTFKPKINIAFVIRYSMQGQRNLRPHNDASHVTTTVLLNSNFTGGGVRFTRYNCSLTVREPGTLLMHPGRVTHNHLAFPITSGERYVLVSFNE